jgi:hypothetical protein
MSQGPPSLIAGIGLSIVVPITLTLQTPHPPAFDAGVGCAHPELCIAWPAAFSTSAPDASAYRSHHSNKESYQARSLPHVNAVQDPSNWQRLIAETESTLRLQKRAFQIGTLDTDTTQIFGRIAKVEIGPTGDVFILDDQALAIRWFDRHGRFRHAVGRGGLGPGEFRSPVNAVLDTAGQLHVLDVRLQRVTVYKAGIERLERLREVVPEVPMSEFCVLRGGYYALTPSEDPLIRRLDGTGKVLNAFGARDTLIELSGSFSAALRKSVTISNNRGYLYCDAKRDAVVLVYRERPLIRAFSAGGVLLWETHLRDYHQIRHVPAPARRGIMAAGDPKTGTAHYAYNAVGMSDHILAVTLDDAPVVLSPRLVRETRFFSLADGRELRRVRSPFIIAGNANNRVYGYSQDPYPHVVALDHEKHE